MGKLIWRNITRRRSQSLLTIVITAITVMIFVVMMGVFVTMNTGLRTSKERLGADALIIPKSADASGYELLYTANPENEYMPAEVTEQVAALDGVAMVSPQFFSQTLSGSCCDFGLEMRVTGFDPETDFILKAQMNKKEYENLKDNDIILGGEFTNFVGVKAKILGEPMNVVGELYPTGTGMDKTIFMSIDKARELTENAENLNTLPEGARAEDLISAVMVKLDEGVDPAKFESQFNYFSGIDAQCIATNTTIATLQGQLSATAKIMFILWVSMLVVTVLALIGRFNALAKDRKKEIGLLRAIGVQKKGVFALVIGEACALVLAGGVLGSAAACLLIKPVMTLITETFQIPSSVWSWGLTLTAALGGIVLAVLVGFIASLRPALRSASLEPQKAITQGEVN